ncbi:hypothetical protein HK100_010649 [Physocladia obscura]|uniref:Peptidase A1 domain-containing protein n=1 Tax=Physocladia obscura TaxID=109957 RepID=A0AAD5T866_9FUNG|nr:hypothetical protein HK100_010649 [Physocladia obscura]
MLVSQLLLALLAAAVITITRDPSKNKGPLNSVRIARHRYGLNITLDSDSDIQRRTTYLSNWGDELYTATATLAGQSFSFDLDTGSSDVWVRGPSCTSSDGSCGVAGQPTFSTSGTTATNTGSTWTTVYGSGEVSGDIYSGSVSLDGVSATIKFGVSTFETGFDTPGDGLWGLAFSTINEISGGNFVSLAKITLFSFYLSDWINGDAGELSINAIDSSRYTGTLEYVSLSSDTYYEFNPTGGTFTVNGVSTAVTSGSNGAIADTGTTFWYVPSAIAATLNKAIGAPTYSNSLGVYPIACSVYSTGPSIVFALGSVSISIGPNQYVYSLEDGSCVSGITTIGTISSGSLAYIFGDIFLRAAYTVFDVTNNRLGFAQAIHPAPVVNNPSTSLTGYIPGTATPTNAAATTTTTTAPTTTSTTTTTTTTTAIAPTTTSTTTTTTTTTTTKTVSTTTTTTKTTTRTSTTRTRRTR